MEVEFYERGRRWEVDRRKVALLWPRGKWESMSKFKSGNEEKLLITCVLVWMREKVGHWHDGSEFWFDLNWFQIFSGHMMGKEMHYFSLLRRAQPVDCSAGCGCRQWPNDCFVLWLLEHKSTKKHTQQLFDEPNDTDRLDAARQPKKPLPTV